MKHTPPPWFGWFTLLCGLFVLVYLSLTEGSITTWIFPTGVLAAIMVAVGFLWILRQR